MKKALAMALVFSALVGSVGFISTAKAADAPDLGTASDPIYRKKAAKKKVKKTAPAAESKAAVPATK